MHVITGGSQRIGVRAHSRKKQNNLLLMVANVSTQANVLCHKDTNFGGRWQVLCRE